MGEYKSVQLKWQQAKDTEPGREGAVIGERRGNRFWITFNRPRRFNAFTQAMYDLYKDLIAVANEDPQVKFIVVSGAGANFSSGNDLGNFTNPHYMGIGDIRQISTVAADHLKEFCSAIINSKKPIFALVEGKVIGFAFTQLALYDRVFAVEGASFNAPLVQLAQGPEMAASVTFPRLFGKAVAEDLLVKGKRVDTSFLAKYGFLSSYKDRSGAEGALNQHLSELEELQWQSFVTARWLLGWTQRKERNEANERQCLNLIDRWSNPELPAHIMEYLSRLKSKAKL